MVRSAVLEFNDPLEYQRAVRGTELLSVVTEAGEYRAKLIQIDLARLWMQSSWTSLPQINRSAVSKARSVLFFPAAAQQPAMQYDGMEVGPGNLVLSGRKDERYHKVPGAFRWRAMSLSPDDLAAAGRTIAGREFTSPDAPQVLKAPPELASRLNGLHEVACQLASTAPDILAHHEVARALEQELVRLLAAGFGLAKPTEKSPAGYHRVSIMQRFERYLETNQDRPVHLAELCEAIGVSSRMLRARCVEQLGMGPHHYLWLRRMHLARHALAQADPSQTTVTTVATDQGFGELGRFAVAYRKLFGELPSATLRRLPGAAEPTPLDVKVGRRPLTP